jgi:hypothetical protein
MGRRLRGVWRWGVHVLNLTSITGCGHPLLHSPDVLIAIAILFGAPLKAPAHIPTPVRAVPRTPRLERIPEGISARTSVAQEFPRRENQQSPFWLFRTGIGHDINRVVRVAAWTTVPVDYHMATLVGQVL